MYREARLLYKHCYSTLSFFRDIIVTLFLSLMVGEEPWFAPNLDKNITQKSLSLSIYQSPSSRYYRHVFLPICLFSLSESIETERDPFCYGGSVLISLSSRRSSCESEQCYWRRRWWLAPGSAKMRRRFSNAKTVMLVKEVLPFFFLLN